MFFTQERSSLNGRIFKLYKFRTMIVDAEKKLAELLKNNEMRGPVFKMENDPRVTKIGRILRKYSIDEFPQFWNVFKGDMSLVGPRPPIPMEVDKYEPWHRRRLSMRPGLTCIWQMSGRNKITDFDEWMRLDLEYIDNWSLRLDFKILFGTVPAVLAGSGAK
ncbi:MAG: sugar transferase [Planctomycetes bacterium]|nr:sugar transferase [Planctomycetota bacterium]